MNYLEKQFAEYEQKVFKFAEEEFKRVVKPYLIRAKYNFYAGNGDYFIERVSDGKTIDHDDLPKYVKNVLSMEIPGMDGNDLGSLMPDFDYKRGA